MASEIGDGDYLGAYRRFFVDFLDKVNPEDQLPIKTSGHDVTEGEIVGEIIYMTLQYLDQQVCPPSLQCYIVKLVIEEIKATCRKQPDSCGFRQEEKKYEPLKLMQAVTGKVNEICQRYLENSRLALLPPPPSTPMPLATAFAIRNNRRKMEDRHVILHDLNTIFNIKDDSIGSYYAVFDGHAGYQAAVFCATHLHQYLAESRHYPTDPERALRDAFLTTDASFIEKSTEQTLSSGTTAVCALILNRKLYVAWVGDSQAALAKRGIVTQLVNPHKPDRNDERERVEEMGGMVMHLGIWRVNGNLAVSRAIGDAQYKPYVTGDPEIRCITLDGQEDFLIIACDGLWDCVTEKEAATLVYLDVCRDPYNYSITSQRLVDYAKNQGSADNITVIVVFLTTPRQIASRSTYGNPLLADVGMNNMEPDNRYLSNANGCYDVNSTFVKQQATPNNGSTDLTMDDEYENNYGNKSSNGKRHENGDQVDNYNTVDDDDDLGPETDVDAVDDISEPVNTLADVSRQLFTEKPDSSEIFRNDECMDDDSPPSPSATKSNQRALIPDADNVGDSEDSEDEWNYYRIDPNKEKEEVAGAAAGFGPLEKTENEIIDNAVVSSPLIDEKREDNIIDQEEKREISKNDNTDSSSSSSADSESDREISTNVLIDNEIRADTNFEPIITESLIDTENIDEQEEKKIKDDEEEGNKENDEEEEMDFQLNPNAAEFVPVSPTLAMPTRIDLDVPISGSPLKQTPPMDDIKIPSKREFENEARHRPHEIEENTCTNGELLEDLNETAAATASSEKLEDKTTLMVNLDESEISSTKAEFGDESSFLNAGEFQRTGISNLDGSYTGSYGEFDDSTIDPMTKSFGPGDFMALSNPVDLNAVHDLTDTDLMADDGINVTQETDEIVTINQRNLDVVDDDDDDDDDDNDNDDDSNKSRRTLDPFADERIDNPLDSSSPISFPQSPVNEISSNIEEKDNAEIPIGDHPPQTSNLLEYDQEEIDEKPVDISRKYDDFEIDQPMIVESEKSSIVIPEVQDETNITTKLLEMDLEDRGSQVCGFEKCNEKWPEHKDTTKDDDTEKIEEPMVYTEKIEESMVYTEKIEEPMDYTEKIEEPIDHTSFPVLSDNLVEKFNLPENILTERMENVESTVIDEITESIENPVAPNEDLISSRHSSVPDVPVLHNPLDLDVVAPSSMTSQENILLLDDSYENDTKIPNILDSPEVGVSPLVEERSKNPFDQMEFSNPESHLKQQEIDILTTVEEIEDAKPSVIEQNDNISEQKDPIVENDNISVQKSPIVEDDYISEQKSLIVENENISEEKSFIVESENISEEKIIPIVENEKILEEKITIVEDENVSDQKSKIVENENISEEKSPIVEDENISIIEETANVSTGLKLSESLQEFTGLEEQLNPEKVSNGLGVNDENLMEICKEETKDESNRIPEMIKIVSEDVENKMAELMNTEVESKTNDEKAEIMEKASVVVASVAATVAAVGTAVAAKTSKPPAAKTAGNKVAPKTGASSKTSTNKSTPTSPTKQASTNRTSTTTAATKKTSTLTSTATRPNKLETLGKTALSGVASAKTSTATTAKSAAASTKTAKTAGRTSMVAAPKSKTSGLSVKSSTTTTTSDKKPTSNGEATKTSISSIRASSTTGKVSSAISGKPLVKSSASSGQKTSISSTTTTTTTGSASSRPKTATSSTASRLSSKTTTTTTTTTTATTTTGAVGTTTQRPKTAPASTIGGAATSHVAKSRLSSNTKSPITEKHIKDTANKQISSSRTGTTTTTSKTSRISATSSTSTKRLTATKTTTASSTTNNTSTPAIPPPIRKPGSMTNRVTPSKTTTTNGKTNNSTKTTSSATSKTKLVVENGVCTAEREIDIVTSTTTSTIVTTGDSNEEDVPKKDISPVEPPTDNQLIITAD